MKLLIHPGFHKTGTSWLQKSLFSTEALFNSLFSHTEIDSLLVRPHDLDFDAEKVRSASESRFENGQPEAVPVISSEILSGTIFDGSRDSKALADRLYACFPDSKILLTVRNQCGILTSVYVQYLKRGGRRSFEDFLNYACEPGYHWFVPSCLNFGQLTEYYASLFGAENVVALPQELLARNRDTYLDHLVRFASGGAISNFDHEIETTAVGKSPPYSGLSWLRFGNLFGSRPMNPEAINAMSWIGTLSHKVAYRWTFRETEARAKLTKIAEAFVKDRYRSDNAILQRYCPIDLGKLAYPM